MSWTKQTTIWCDECGNWDQVPGSSVKVARFEVKRTGWIFTSSGEDICPRCVERIKHDFRLKINGD